MFFGVNELDSRLHEGHRERMRQEFVSNGCQFENVEHHKILEMLLFYAIPRKDTNETAHRLINRFGSLTNVFNATLNELSDVEGVSKNTAVYIKLLAQLNKICLAERFDKKPVFTSPEQAGEYVMTRFLGEKDEIFALISMSGSGEVLGFDVISDGSASAVGINSRKVLETVINRRAVSVILAHNHPGGLALPSGEDIASTKALVSLLKNVGINVIDHFIVCDDDYVSLAQSKDFCGLFK